MRWRWIALAAALALLVGAPVLVAYRLLQSEQGLQLVLAQLGRIPNVRIEATGASGTLAGPLTIERLVIEHDAVHVEARGLRLHAVLRSLLAGNLKFVSLSAEAVDVVLKERAPPPPREPGFLPRFLAIEAPAMRLSALSLTLVNGERIEAASARAALDMTRWRIRLTDLVIEDPAGRLEGDLTLRAAQPLELRVAANGHWRLPDERVYRFAGVLGGNLDRLGTTLTLSEPANLSFIGNALALTEEPRVVGTLRFTDFDGSPWIEAGRFPQASGSIALDARRAAVGLDGTVTSPALEAGPLRVQGAGEWLDSTLRLDSLRAWLPRLAASASVAGTIRFIEDSAPELKLAGEWSGLRWPLMDAATVESPYGAFSVAGSLPYSFDVRASTSAPDLPAADFTAAGSADRERVVLDRFDGQLMGGRLQGSGRLSWTGEQRWNARLEGQRLDIATVRPDLPGRVTFAGTIEGRGFTPAAPWTMRLASLSGTVRGRALTGRGEVAHRNGTYDLRRVRIATGSSHVDVDGRWGPSIDLRWNADVRQLSLLHPDLKGELLSSGHARGSPTRPEASGEVRVKKLRFGAVGVELAQASVDVDLSDRRESRVDLRAEDIDLGALQLESASLAADGQSHQHAVDLRFESAGDPDMRIPGFRTKIAATGEYDAADARWLGNLHAASIEFPDGGATLLQPVALEAGRAALRVAPLCLATGESRFCVEGEWRAEPASWRVLYSAQDWPLRRILHSLLGWREFDGKLQASGWAAQEPGHTWTGGTTLLLDNPTLDIPRNQFRTERVSLGAARLDLFAEPDAIRATLEASVAENSRLTGEVTARREPGLGIVELPLSGVLRAESSDITGMPILVPEIDRSGGQFDGLVSVSGLLGAPRFDGEFHLRDGLLHLYRTNLQLTGLTLDGRFKGDELVFEGSGSAARGTLSLDGRFSWPEEVMTGQMRLKGDGLMVADTPDFRVVASPDLLFAVGPDGYDVTGVILVPLARITPRDLSTTVGTSTDERIVGLEVEELGPSTLERLRSRIRIELGDNVRVNSFGLNATLAGEITVITRPGDVVRGDGAIRVVEGEYKAFGQFVRITRGILSFDMAPLNDPTLDLVAEREIRREDIVVSINVRGTLASPFITLSSDPPMSQNEALSYLLTGRSINTLQSGEAATVDRAAQSLALSGGGLLLGGLGSRVGLDEVTVEQTGEDDTAVVLGKYLSPNLFVSYGISIAEAINTIKLRYTLNQNWSLKAEAGLEQSADVEYRIER
jgi:translocation and assembly module TamB